MKGCNALINQAIQDGMFPGAAISVGDKNGELFRATYGQRCLYPQQLPAEPDTLFDLASLTKIISTTMVALVLVDMGKLKLSDKLSQFYDTPACKQDITIHQLMTHTSGLPAHVPLYKLSPTPQHVYSTILNQPLKPDGDVVYSCLGYILLGKICEIIGGATLDKLAHRYIFAPLGLQTIAYNPCAKTHTFAATEYCNISEMWLSGIVHDENARFMGGVSGNAGLFADINDCATLAIMLANKGMHNSQTIINRGLFDTAIHNHTTHCSEGRGLGFVIKGHTPVSCGDIFPVGSYGHTGFTGTSIWVNAETSQYVVFLTNRVHPTREDNRLAAFRGLLHDCCAKEYTALQL
ncbi:MAG: beta-lactamase family protein [Defluviitaleaceae bacterium]|nr:beta-lactamase family protein [Defluviitaleaceae bacterium]